MTTVTSPAIISVAKPQVFPSWDQLLAMGFGVNVSGPEQGGGLYPGTVFSQVMIPNPMVFAWYVKRNIRIIRLPLPWERLQPEPMGPLGSVMTALGGAPGGRTSIYRQFMVAILETLRSALAAGVKVLLDCHNYGSRHIRLPNGTWVRNATDANTAGVAAPTGKDGYIIGSSFLSEDALPDLWRRMAIEMMPGGMFYEVREAIWGVDLMNEWAAGFGGDAGAATITRVQQKCITAIRNTGWAGYIVVEGNSYSGWDGWKTRHKTGTLDTLSDPLKRLVYGPHCYPDKDFSGLFGSEANGPANNGLLSLLRDRLAGANSAKAWFDSLPAGHSYVGGLLGETGAPNTPEWQEVIREGLAYCRDNRIMACIWGQWPVAYTGQLQRDYVTNLFPVPQDTGEEKIVTKTLNYFNRKAVEAKLPVGTGLMTLPALVGPSGGLPRVSTAGVLGPAYLINRPGNMPTVIEVLSQTDGSVVANLYVGSTNKVMGILPAVGTYDVRYTQTTTTGVTRTQTRTGGLVVSVAEMTNTVTYTSDGSVGQQYAAPAGMTNVQWFRRLLAEPYTDVAISGATATTYTSTTTDAGYRLICQGTVNGVVVKATARTAVNNAIYMIDNYEDLANRTVMGTGVTFELDTTDFLLGTSSLKITTGTSIPNNGVTTVLNIDPAKVGDTYVVGVKRSADFNQWTESLFKGVYSANGGQNGLGGRSKDWQWLVVEAGTGLANATPGGFTGRDLMNLTVATPGIIGRVDAKIAQARQVLPFITPSFDDGYGTTAEIAYPILAALGFLAITFSAPDFLTQSNRGSGDSLLMTLEQQKFLYNRLWDCGTDSGPKDEPLGDGSTAFPRLTPAQAVAQVNAARQKNINNGMTRGGNIMCYSFLQWNEEQAAALVAAGYDMCRGGNPGLFHTRFGILEGIRRNYPSRGFNTTTDHAKQLQEGKDLVDSAIKTGSNLSFHHHFLTNRVGTGTGNATPLDNVFIPLYEYIAAKRDAGLLEVGTPTQLIARDGIGPRIPLLS